LRRVWYPLALPSAELEVADVIERKYSKKVSGGSKVIDLSTGKRNKGARSPDYDEPEDYFEGFDARESVVEKMAQTAGENRELPDWKQFLAAALKENPEGIEEARNAFQSLKNLIGVEHDEN
jgi:hypothetical protein